MKKITTIAAALGLWLGATGYAVADNDHEHGSDPLNNENGLTVGQAGMMQEMMRLMMQMHGLTMDNTMTNFGSGSDMAMMDGEVMGMMMGSGMMYAGMAGSPDPEAMHSALLDRLAEFDADDDGSLSLAEFETLHSAMIHETVVDRFQHLDADGDGRITEAEMAAPARRMEMMREMQGPPVATDGQISSDN